ncbi:MAG: prenyltransferase [Ilumatobacteraceae bacterium]
MSTIPDLPGVLSCDDVVVSGGHLASLQTASGMIPWFPGGHCDPWNHVESAMALDVAGFHTAAEHAYEWLADIQRADGSWHNYYIPDGGRDDTVEDAKVDTNVCAYIATGVWHHWRCTADRSFVDNLWPTVERALDFVLSLRRDDGLVLWATEADGTRTWDYSLLTGTSSIQQALRCGAATGLATGSPRPDWVVAADVMAEMVNSRPDAFEPKTRWAMDWYYPVLAGATVHEAAKVRLADGWPTFSMEGLGIRCVTDEPWVTASETAEAALAFAAIGDVDTATDLLRWIAPHRLESGAYLTGLVHPDRIVFPDGEHTSYTAAAVVLAADAIKGASAASDLFVPAALRSPIV